MNSTEHVTAALDKLTDSDLERELQRRARQRWEDGMKALVDHRPCGWTWWEYRDGQDAEDLWKDESQRKFLAHPNMDHKHVITVMHGNHEFRHFGFKNKEDAGWFAKKFLMNLPTRMEYELGILARRTP